ncbi:histidine phosphatase family protein [Clostridiaceae bacterium HFYG-1003]|nr:histidine phosphatase family protein [Clostridiaceae bacterium HFYG-1003]
MELFIIRHGQTVANSKNFYYGFTDSPITEKGREQAKAAGIFINKLNYQPDEIFISERTRTHETLELMGFHPASAKIDGRINEQNMGDFECLTFQDISAKYPQAFDEWNADFNNYKPNRGESHLEMYNRVKHFIEELIAKEKDTQKKIMIVTHGGVMRSIYSYINMDNLDVFHSVYFNNCAMIRARYITDRLVMDAIYNPIELMKVFGS